MAILEKEIKTYEDRKAELLAEEGKFVLIRGDEVSGFFDTYHDADSWNRIPNPIISTSQTARRNGRGSISYLFLRSRGKSQSNKYIALTAAGMASANP